MDTNNIELEEEEDDMQMKREEDFDRVFDILSDVLESIKTLSSNWGSSIFKYCTTLDLFQFITNPDDPKNYRK